MDHLVAPVDQVVFDVELAIENQVGLKPLFFPNMDKSSSGTCNFYNKGECKLGRLCPLRHVKRDKGVVCKHWLRGLCKKGDDCNFRHIFEADKMPECYFYSMNNSCTNKDCAFLHISKESKISECPWFNRGFCNRGPDCKLKHVRRIFCPNFMAGFCPNGNECQHKHGKFYVKMAEFKYLLSQASL